MTYLLDDPSPRVRLALCEALAASPEAPRPIILALAQDQPEVACHALLCSPILTDSDLVDLAGGGAAHTRALIAARPGLSPMVCAALAEVSDMPEIVTLLENRAALISRLTLARLAERHGGNDEVRCLLLDHPELPAEARQTLVSRVTEALAGADLVRAVVSARRMERVAREAGTAATLSIAGSALPEDVVPLIDHLRAAGRLTPAFLMHALCCGRGAFFAAALLALSPLDERRSRAIMNGGRRHAVRALLESCGFAREIAEIFTEAVLVWREAVEHGDGESLSAALISRLRRHAPASESAAELVDMIEQLQIAEERHHARLFAGELALAAAE